MARTALGFLTLVLAIFSVPAAVKVTARALENVVYAVPGNSEPGEQQLLRLDVKVGEGAKLGQRDIRVTNSGQAAAEAAKFFLLVERKDR